jgi:hypothetical protein
MTVHFESSLRPRWISLMENHEHIHVRRSGRKNMEGRDGTIETDYERRSVVGKHHDLPNKETWVLRNGER